MRNEDAMKSQKIKVQQLPGQLLCIPTPSGNQPAPMALAAQNGQVTHLYGFAWKQGTANHHFGVHCISGETNLGSTLFDPTISRESGAIW